MIQETIQTANPPPETPPPVQPRKKPGILRGWLDMWRDRDLNLDGRDTSSWNIYYYFYRQVVQHRAPVKLKYLKWFALLVHAYFIGAFALVFLIFWAHRSTDGFGATAFRKAFRSLVVLFHGAPYVLFPVLLFIPLFMVLSAFKLRSKSRYFMTSRAKGSPLLVHLVEYTSGDSLVQGAMQSLFYTWGRFALLLLPSIVASFALLAIMLLMWDISTDVVLIDLFLILAPLGVTFSIFLFMQGFCYRLDTLIVMLAMLIESGIFLYGIVDNVIVDLPAGLMNTHQLGAGYWGPMLLLHIPLCVLACIYFPLAAIDTNTFGLGQRSSKRLRVMLFALAGVFIAMLFARNGIELATGQKSLDKFKTLNLFEIYGLFITVCGLLVSSVSMTSHRAEMLSRSRPDETFLRRIFDPASPLSLIPVFLLEAVSIAVLFLWHELFPTLSSSRLPLLTIALLSWAVLHFGLFLVFTKQRFKQDMKSAWLSHTLFNKFCISLGILIMLARAFFKRQAVTFAIVTYIVSILIWCFILLIEKRYSAHGKDLMTGSAPTWNRKGNAP